MWAKSFASESVVKGSLDEFNARENAQRGMTLIKDESVLLKDSYEGLATSAKEQVEDNTAAIDNYIKVIDDADKRLLKAKQLKIETNAPEVNEELDGNFAIARVKGEQKRNHKNSP